MKSMLIAPSLFAGDLTNLREEVLRLEKLGVDYLHLDIMDGHFVPNISFGSRTVKLLRPLTRLPFDVHLMLSDPLRHLNAFVEAGANLVTFHLETGTNIETMINTIKSHRVKVGVSLKPNTPAELLKPYLADLDLILVMSVEPGFSGQPFQPKILAKVEQLFSWKKEYKYLIEVDGGVNAQNIQDLRKAGCDMVVVGSYLFESKNRQEALRALKQ